VVVRANESVKNLSVSFLVRDADGLALFGTTTFDEKVKLPHLSAGGELSVGFHFDAALAADPSVQLRVADAYVTAGLFEDALAGYDAWIAGHPKAGEDLAGPLAGRCRARAFLNRDLDKALADCDQALKLVPGVPAALDSRALAELRLGQPDKAIADFNQVLKVEPRDAWALYGRGLAKLKQGDKAGADADLAAATALQPSLPQQAKNVGLAS